MKTFMLIFLLLLPSVALAAERPERPKQTESWLELQRSGQAASPHFQGASAGERERSLDRWLKSFEHAIPESYEQQNKKKGGN